MFSSPNSFSMTAIFWPWNSVSTRLSRVVLPEPRKPVRMVAGIRPVAGVVMLGCSQEALVQDAAAQVCSRGSRAR
jgi:hypothetical protein